MGWINDCVFSSVSMVLLGYSLTFSHEAGKFLGKLDNFALMNVLAAPSVGSALIPDILFMFLSINVCLYHRDDYGRWGL